MRCYLLAVTLLVPATAQTVNIRVDAQAARGPWRPVWAFFGYDEPNYTYAKDGVKLLGELGALSPAPVYIRTHNLLTSGDGAAALKWGSTNAYTEDASGKPVYDWKILDRIFDTYRQTRVRPLVEIGFMPQALSVKPEPYRHSWPQGPLATGWAYPPKDYAKWGQLVFEWVRHAAERYGAREVESWYWEVWNEPDISYWRGTPEEYFKLYDTAAVALKRALPGARIGGPHSTGPGSEKAAAFLRSFLEHCRKERVPLDYIGFHAKGAPRMVEGHVQMGIAKQARDVARGFEIVASFPEFRSKPVIIGESDPEGCAACSAATTPQNAYRNTALYAAYTAAMLKQTLEAAGRHGTNLAGAVTWAFEFEDQPWFAGLRTLATHGVDKPVLNLFRMLGLMGGRRLALSTDGGYPVENGVRGQPSIDGLATGDGNRVSVLLWNYHDDDVPALPADVELAVTGLPAGAGRVLMHHYRIDERHSNAYTRWKEMGAPQQVSAEQYATLEAAGRLEMLASPQWLWAEGGRLRASFTLPRQGVSLVQFRW